MARKEGGRLRRIREEGGRLRRIRKQSSLVRQCGFLLVERVFRRKIGLTIN